MRKPVEKSTWMLRFFPLDITTLGAPRPYVHHNQRFVNWSDNAGGNPFEASGKGFEISVKHFDCGRLQKNESQDLIRRQAQISMRRWDFNNKWCLVEDLVPRLSA
jgi:hypothetical protein